MKYISEKAYEYMKNTWGLDWNEEVDDLRMMYENDEPECVAKMLYGYGAIEPNCPEAREIIKVAKSLTEIGFRRKLNKVLKKYVIVECSNCDHTHFIPPYCDAENWVKGNCDGCAQKGFNKIVK
jgi:hypothetical protein